MSFSILRQSFFMALSASLFYVFFDASAQQPPDQTALASESAALAEAYDAYLSKNAKEITKQTQSLPKTHLLRPWAMGWSLLSDPNANPEDLFSFSKKFPPTLMKWRLANEAGIRMAKRGEDPQAVRVLLSTIPQASLNSQSRCALAAGTSIAPDEAGELLSNGSGSDLCAKTVAAALANQYDIMGAAFLRMGKEQASAAAAALESRGVQGAVQTLAFAQKMAETPIWAEEYPLVSREAFSRDIATQLGKGKCTSTLPAPAKLTEKGQANSARCALWNGRADLARNYWQSLNAAKPGEPRWAFLLWASDPARPAQPPSANETSYFAAFARSLSRAPAVISKTIEPSQKCEDAQAILVLTLWDFGLHKEAIDAWRDEIERSDPARKACLGGLAATRQAHPLRIAAFAGPGYVANAYEPGFESIVRQSALAHEIPESLWISLARQESRFDAAASSRAGAQGLFQLMPSTAAEAASQAKIPLASQSLLDPKTNAAIASFYFAKILTQFDRHPVWSLCAYNAGAGRCRGWSSKLEKLPAVFQIEAIPYDETRIYIERIFAGWDLTAPSDPTKLDFLTSDFSKKQTTKNTAAKKR